MSNDSKRSLAWQGNIGFRQHTGGHTDGPTWPTFLTFADKYIKLKK